MSDKPLIVPFAQADVPNKNGHIYPRETLEQMIEDSKKRDHNWVIMGIPEKTTVDLHTIVGEASNLHIDADGNVLAEITIMKTPMGEVVQTLIDKGIESDYRMAGYGDVDDQGVITNFQLISIGVVAKGTGA